jgi:hypothetical protein
MMVVLKAASRACAKTGNKIAARIAMIAMTTNNSIKVNPLRNFIISCEKLRQRLCSPEL